MTNKAKIVFIGAGSMSFGLSMFRDVFASTELAGSTLTLVGRDAGRLARSVQLARLMNERSGAGLKIEHTVDRRAALDGAEFVVNATAIERNQLWKSDFEVPKKYGIRHTLGENGGPGGLFFTLRTLPIIFDFARDMEELCPDALFINYSNPESRIICALGKYCPPSRSKYGARASITSNGCCTSATARPAKIFTRCCARGKSTSIQRSCR